MAARKSPGRQAHSYRRRAGLSHANRLSAPACMASHDRL